MKVMYNTALLIFTILCSGAFTTASALDADMTCSVLVQAQMTEEGGNIGPAQNRDGNDNINKVEDLKVDKKDAQETDRKEEVPRADNKRIKFLSDKGEYIGLFLGYGGYFPVADYGAQYRPANMVSGTVGIYILNIVGLSPELHVRYAMISNKKEPLRYNSDISLIQFFPGIIYRYHVPLPRNTLTVYGRIWDGASRVAYSSRNSFFPVMKIKIVEYINIFGVSAGFYYDIWKGILAGVDFSYSIISTAGKPLQAVTLTLNVGYRIL